MSNSKTKSRDEKITELIGSNGKAGTQTSIPVPIDNAALLRKDLAAIEKKLLLANDKVKKLNLIIRDLETDAAINQTRISFLLDKYIKSKE